MAYTAPKWTQMTAPSGTTSVNALTAAGDLFSKAMESAQTGLSNYDKGVEARLKDDSDVNTAALRRRLEGATDLASLNAMQGDISATGLEGYGKRIDADALSQSFDKERGVLRGEAEQQYGEQFQQQLNDATTIEEYTAIRDSMSANPTWYDDASRIQSLGAGMEGARTLEANTASTALSQSFVGKSYDELAAMAKLVKPGDLNADQDLAAIASQQNLVRSDAQTDYDNSGEKSLLAAAKKGGRGALEAEMARLTTEASKPGSKIDLSNVLSTYQGLVAGANETTATNTVVGAVANQSEMFATNDAAILSVVTGLGAEQYVTVNPVTGQPTFKPGTPEAVKSEVIAGLADAGYVTPPKGVASKTEFINNLLEQKVPLKIAQQMYEDTNTTLANTYELIGAGKEALATQTVGFKATKERAIADATSIRDAARLKTGNAAQGIADATAGPADIFDWIRAKLTGGGKFDYTSNEDAGEVMPTIKKILENGIGDPNSKEEGAWIAGKDIDTTFIKLVLARNGDNVGNYKGDINKIGDLVFAMQKDDEFNGQVQRVLAVDKAYQDAVTAADSEYAASRSAASTELKLKYDVRSTTNMDPSIAQMADKSTPKTPELNLTTTTAAPTAKEVVQATTTPNKRTSAFGGGGITNAMNEEFEGDLEIETPTYLLPANQKPAGQILSNEAKAAVEQVQDINGVNVTPQAGFNNRIQQEMSNADVSNNMVANKQAAQILLSPTFDNISDALADATPGVRGSLILKLRQRLNSKDVSRQDRSVIQQALRATANR